MSERRVEDRVCPLNRLLVVDKLFGPAGSFAPADLEALGQLEGRLLVAVREREASSRDERALADGLAIRYLPPDRRFRDPQRLVASARAAVGAVVRHPLGALQLNRRCRTTPATRASPLRHLLRHLAFLGMDVDVVHFESPEVYLAYPLLSELLAAPSIVTCRASQVDVLEHGTARARALVMRVLTQATGVECATAEIANRVGDLTGRSTRTWVRPRTVVADRSPGRPAARDNGPPLIMAIGRLAYPAGFDHLLMAVAQLHMEGVSFRVEIVGDGPLRRPLQYTIDELGLVHDVELRGDVPAERLTDHLRRADIFVAPGRGTALDDAIRRAMAVGVPVVTTPVGSCPELIRDGIEGYVVPERDIDALANRIHRLVGDESERRALGAAARARVDDETSPERQASRLEGMYLDVVDQWRTAAGSRARHRVREAEHNRPTIGSYYRTFPKETFSVTKLLGLLDAGFDVRVFAGAPTSGYWERFPALSDRADLRGRVHYLADRHRSPWGGAGALRGFVATAGRHPIAFFRFVAHNWKTRKTNTFGFWRGISLRLPFVGQTVDILHVENDSWGSSVADLKDYLGCHLLLSSQATLQHGVAPDGGPVQCEYLFTLADGYHFGSDYLRSNTLALGLDPALPSWVIKPGVDVELFKPMPRRPRRFRDEPLQIVSVGRLAWWKGYHFALEAIARVREAGVRATYTIVGEGALEADLRSVMADLDLQGIVRFAGGASPAAVVAEYRAADVMLHAAIDEGLGYAVLEAMAMALPVVATDAGGISEGVDDGVTGYVVPRRDAQALADKLVLLAEDHERRDAMGRAGRERVVAHFDLRKQIAKFEAVYRELSSLPVRNRP